MTLGYTFAQAFWDSDIIGTSGWDAICRRMKDGKKVCSEFAHYLRDRAKAETDYSKALQNLVRKADGREEIGALGDSWRTLKTQTDRIASVHEEAANTFNSLQEIVNKFNDEQTKCKKQTEENVKKFIQSKKSEYQKTMTLKKSYEDKCKEFNNAEENLKTVRSSVTTKKNELEKAETKVNKSKETRESADLAYKNAIESLEIAKRNWEREHIQACGVFEEMERKRIETLRDLMWRVTNVDSLACVKHDECSESVRTVLEKCDIDEDMQGFINKSMVENTPPEPIKYENYYTGKPPVRPARSSVSHQRSAPALDEGIYSSVDNQPPNSGTTMDAHVPFLWPNKKSSVTGKRYASELNVCVGDFVEYIGTSSRKGMCKVKTQDRKMGLVPMSCLKRITESQSGKVTKV